MCACVYVADLFDPRSLPVSDVLLSEWIRAIGDIVTVFSCRQRPPTNSSTHIMYSYSFVQRAVSTLWHQCAFLSALLCPWLPNIH